MSSRVSSSAVTGSVSGGGGSSRSMAASLPVPASTTGVNSHADALTAQLDAIDRRPIKASIDVNRAAGTDIVAIVFETFDAIGWTDKDAAGLMGIDAGQLSLIKQGKRRMPIDALWRLDAAPFWVEFRKRVDVAKGLVEASDEEAFAGLVGNLVRAVLSHRHAVTRRSA